MPRARLDGFLMNYEIHEAVLPADTLFIHGNLSSNSWWRPALDVWRRNARAGERGRAICAEWRGCGGSGAPTSADQLHPNALASDYLRLLRHLGVEHGGQRIHVVGHSTGGLVALYAMSQAPDLFERAVLLDPVSHRGVAFVPAAVEAFRQMSDDRAICQAVMATTIKDVDAGSAFFQELVDDAFGAAPLVWTEMPHVLSTIDAREIVQAIQVPTRILHGEFDPILPIAGSAALARRLPHGEFFEIKGRGHSTNVEDPALFAGLVNDHLFN